MRDEWYYVTNVNKYTNEKVIVNERMQKKTERLPEVRLELTTFRL